MVGTYEPYVEVCRRLAELSPCPRRRPEVASAPNSGAEAIKKPVKYRALRRPAAFGDPCSSAASTGWTLLTLTMTEKVADKAGFAPLAPKVYRAPAPYLYRGVTSDGAISALERLLKAEASTGLGVACAVLEPVQGEGGFIPMPADFPRRGSRSSSTRDGPLERRRRGAVGSRADR